MSNIAVIGCGVFGGTIALKLQSDGHSVTVFERLPHPMLGASYNNQNRLHLGYHYPRDMETARQCIEGFNDFRETFPDCVVSDFDNAYFIASEGSRTSPEDYLTFCAQLGIVYQEIDPKEFSPEVANVSLGVLTKELVYDSALLGRHIADSLVRSNVDVRYNTDVDGIARLDNKLEIHLIDGSRETFDIVVNATYASISRLSDTLGLPQVDRQYEYTAVPIIRAPFQRTGITIMDGGFMTVLPFGKTQHHLLYHVEHTVLEREVGVHLTKDWLDKETSPFSKIDAVARFGRIKDAAREFVPSIAEAELVGFLHGPRMVLAKRDDTDARPSIIDNPVEGYYTVFSGKIDHCMWISKDIANRIRELKH